MGTPFPPRRVGALVIVAALGACACRSPDQLEHITAALTPSGELRILARRMNGQDEAGSYWARNFRYAEQRDGSWRAEALRGGEGDRGTPSFEAPSFVIATADRTFVVANVDAGTIVRVRPSVSSAWEDVTADPALPSGAMAALLDPAALGGAWVGSDGELHMLVGEWLLETSGSTITTAIPTGDTCAPTPVDIRGMPDSEGYLRGVCSFVPTGDRAGTALVFELMLGTADHTFPVHRTTFRRLSCALDVCSWIVDPADGLGELAFEETIFIQLSDGTPTVVKLEDTALAAMTTTRTVPIATGVYRFGAAPRPAGGFVVVSSAYYTDALAITVVNTAFETRRLELPTIVLDGSVRLGVIVAPATSTATERAHLLLSTSAASIAHLTVDLETGAVEREDFGI